MTKVRIADLHNGPIIRGGSADPMAAKSSIDLDHVARLVEVGPDAWPPVTVQEGKPRRLLDGFHRKAAAKELGLVEIEADLRDCTDSEAFEIAVRANIDHGLPLTLAERKGAAKHLVDETDWSDRRIAEVCGLDRKTVAPFRVGKTDHPETRKGKNEVPQPSPAIARVRRKKAEEMVAENPDATVEQIVKKTSVSQTVAYEVKKAAENPPPFVPKVVPPTPDEPTEPTVDDLVPMVAVPWKREPKCKATNATRTFAALMDRYAVDALDGIEDSIAEGCPADHACEAVASTQAREVAAMWTRIADRLSGNRAIRGA